MLAGAPPFTGPTAQAIVAKTLTEEPKALTLLRRSVPPHVEIAVHRALEKLPADRFASAAAFADALATPLSIVPTRAREAHRRGPPWRTTALLAAGALVIAALGWGLGRASASRQRRPVRFTIELDSGVLRFGEPAISPDGETIVYAAEGPDARRLYVRRVDDIAARPLAGTENAEAAFFSPNGAWVAFYANGALRKVRLDGGAAAVVAELPRPGQFAGATWGSDDVMYYAISPSGTLFRVPAAGGRPSPVTVADSGVRLLGPHSLRGQRALLVTVMDDFSYVSGGIAVLDLGSGRVRIIGPGLGARYAAGNLVYGGVRGELFRQPFDLRRLTPTGVPEQLAGDLSPAATYGHFAFDVSEAGSLVYVLGARRYSRGINKLAIVDSVGREQQAVPARTPWGPRSSPDGRRVAYGAFAPGRESSDLWVTDLETGATQRLTADPNDSNDPVWKPDGKSLAYDKNAPGGKDGFVQALDGGLPQPLVRRAGDQWTSDWLRNGSAVLFTELTTDGDLNIWIQPTDGGAARPYLATLAFETGGRASPDGRWVAYQSDETGRDEVYVQSYPSPGNKRLVSATGGVNPIWSRDGRALYYWKVDQLMVARVELGGTNGPLRFEKPTLLFRAPYVEAVLPMYDVSPDGRQFILVTAGTHASRLVVALDALGPGEARAPDRR
jgi:serine/threonine-protein kinase